MDEWMFDSPVLSCPCFHTSGGSQAANTASYWCQAGTRDALKAVFVLPGKGAKWAMGFLAFALSVLPVQRPGPPCGERDSENVANMLYGIFSTFLGQHK